MLKPTQNWFVLVSCCHTIIICEKISYKTIGNTRLLANGAPSVIGCSSGPWINNKLDSFSPSEKLFCQLKRNIPSVLLLLHSSENLSLQMQSVFCRHKWRKWRKWHKWHKWRKWRKWAKRGSIRSCHSTFGSRGELEVGVVELLSGGRGRGGGQSESHFSNYCPKGTFRSIETNKTGTLLFKIRSWIRRNFDFKYIFILLTTF